MSILSTDIFRCYWVKVLREDLVMLPKVIYLPSRELVRLGRDRWIVYLPKEYNELWEEIKRRRLKVRIFIQLVENTK